MPLVMSPTRPSGISEEGDDGAGAAVEESGANRADHPSTDVICLFPEYCEELFTISKFVMLGRHVDMYPSFPQL